MQVLEIALIKLNARAFEKSGQVDKLTLMLPAFEAETEEITALEMALASKPLIGLYVERRSHCLAMKVTSE